VGLVPVAIGAIGKLGVVEREVVSCAGVAEASVARRAPQEQLVGFPRIAMPQSVQRHDPPRE